MKSVLAFVLLDSCEIEMRLHFLAASDFLASDEVASLVESFLE